MLLYRKHSDKHVWALKLRGVPQHEQDLDYQDHKTHTYMIMNNKKMTYANAYDRLLNA